MARYSPEELHERAYGGSEPRRLLTLNQGLGSTEGFAAVELRLAPGEIAGVMNTCPHASVGCLASCLYYSSRSGNLWNDDAMSEQVASRIQATRLLNSDPDRFMKLVARDIGRFQREISKFGPKLRVAVRLNCSSDILWERYSVSFVWGSQIHRVGRHIMEAFPEVEFQDYTKIPLSKRNTGIANYHLTFSLSEDNSKYAREALEMGHNVAVVFGGNEIKSLRYVGPIPDEYTIDGLTVPVISSRKSYVRFLDPRSLPGYVIALDAKYRATKDDTGFVKKADADLIKG